MLRKNRVFGPRDRRVSVATLPWPIVSITGMGAHFTPARIFLQFDGARFPVSDEDRFPLVPRLVGARR